MTTPKANRYRLYRLPRQSNEGPGDGGGAASGPQSGPQSGSAPDDLFAPEAASDGFDPTIFSPSDPARSAQAMTHAERQQALAAISHEMLTGRQLRLARRIALRHRLQPESDEAAVLELRLRGIDPFDRAALLSLDGAARREEQAAEAAIPVPTGDARAPRAAPAAPVPAPASKPSTVQPGPPARSAQAVPARANPQLPQTAPQTAPGLAFEVEQAKEIIKIQRDIVRRRRRKMMMLMARLVLFVFLPTFMAGFYYFAVATPMYATKTEFVIQKAEAAGGVTGLGGLFSGTQLATNQDSITVQSFLQSRDAMQKLDADHQFKAHFSAPDIDVLQRLPTDASNEAAYKLYQKVVKIGYDPSEGVIKMEVAAPDPATSAVFSKALVSYAEQQVDRLTSRLREDQMRGARESYEDAETKVVAAQDRVLSLQQKVGVLDPVSENSLIMSQIGGMQGELERKRIELNQLLTNAQPNQARVEGLRSDIAQREIAVRTLRAQLTSTSQGGESLAAVTGQLRIAEADLETRQRLLAAAAQQMETARIEANKQVRYLEMGVRPVAPDEPTYPRAFEDTLLAFLIFSGIYLMLSLTVSILREQVTS